MFVFVKMCLVPGLFSNAPSNSTLTPSNLTLIPSNLTEDPLVTLDLDEVGGGLSFSNETSFSFFLFAVFLLILPLVFGLLYWTRKFCSS